ncbi:alpha/beta-hydrolase, partial [Vararia minispora EC-137]
SLLADLLSGVRHEGTPAGKLEEIAGVKTYIALPEGEYDKTKAVIYLCDAFGIELENNLLLCDDFARNGYQVYAPDLFEGEAATPEFLDDRAAFDFMAWLGRHSPAHNFTRVKGVLDELRKQGVTRFAGTGYCYGGRMVFDFAFADEIQVSATSHPSLLQIADLEKYASTAKAPLLINACEVDEQFPKEKQDKALELLQDFKPGFKQAYFDGCVHGFAVRGDMSDPKVKAGKEGAFSNTVEWFKKYL